LPNISASLEKSFHGELVTLTNSMKKRRPATLSHTRGG
jgi:hypothetical protein